MVGWWGGVEIKLTAPASSSICSWPTLFCLSASTSWGFGVYTLFVGHGVQCGVMASWRHGVWGAGCGVRGVDGRVSSYGYGNSVAAVALGSGVASGAGSGLDWIGVAYASVGVVCIPNVGYFRTRGSRRGSCFFEGIGRLHL